RRVHQHGGAIAVDHAKIAAEGSVARERKDPGSSPAASGKEIWRVGRRSHRGGHRPSHDGGAFAVKILSPFSPKRNDRRSASGQAPAPARSGHSTSSTASADASRPSSSISEGSSIRYRSTCHTGGSRSS